MGYIYIRNNKHEVANDIPQDLILPQHNIRIVNTTLGEGVSIWSNLNIYGAKIGSHTKLASFIEIRSNVCVGNNCKIEPFVFIPEGVDIGSGVFIGPNVTFTNDIYPKAVDGQGELIKDYQITPTQIGNFASIGAGCVIRCGITVGQGAMLGAGSLLVDNVGANEIWYAQKAAYKRTL